MFVAIHSQLEEQQDFEGKEGENNMSANRARRAIANPLRSIAQPILFATLSLSFLQFALPTIAASSFCEE